MPMAETGSIRASAKALLSLQTGSEGGAPRCENMGFVQDGNPSEAEVGPLATGLSA